MLITGCNANRPNLLPLILIGLIVGIWNFKIVFGNKEVQMDRILGRRIVVEAVEHVLAVTLIVMRVKFRRVQESARTGAIGRYEIACLLRSKSSGDFR